jgi:hypothetical protein
MSFSEGTRRSVTTSTVPLDVPMASAHPALEHPRTDQRFVEEHCCGAVDVDAQRLARRGTPHSGRRDVRFAARRPWRTWW